MLRHGRPIKLKREISVLQALRPINRIKTDASLTSGFVLPMVIAGGLILMIGAIILSVRGFSSLTGSIRQGQRTQAEEIAESGANTIIQELNQNYPYLLVENCEVTNNSASEQMEPPQCDEGWDAYNLDNLNPVGVCSQRSEYPEDMMDLLYQPSPEGKGFYRLRRYEFFGDQIQGGTAIIEVQGQLRHGTPNNQKIVSSAILKREVTIVPKCCDSAPYETCNIASGWKYGLTAESMKLQKGDVIDLDPGIEVSGAKVNCSSSECSDPPQSEICEQWNSNKKKIQNMTAMTTTRCKELLENGETANQIADMGVSMIAGERSNDQIDVPKPPTWNPEWTNNGREIEAKSYSNENVTFKHLDQEGPHQTTPCYTEIIGTKKITHCRINNLAYSDNSRITIKPGANGEIRLYIEGEQIALSGEQFIIPDNEGDIGFEQFAIFGSESTQKLAFSGKGRINAFLYMPDTQVEFNGYSYCEHAGVDYSMVLEGIAIVKAWNNAANSDCAQIQVPPDAGAKVCESYGLCSTNASNSSEDMEYVAVGTNRWDFVQMDR